MLTKILVVFLCLAGVVLWLACNKSSDSPANTTSSYYNYPIKGVAYIKTGYNDTTTSVLLLNKPVYIDTTLGIDTGSHFYTQITASDGTFTFYVSDTSRQYRIFTSCYDTCSSTFIPLYYGSVLTNHPYAPNPVYTVTATINALTGMGMIIHTVDKQGNGIPRVNALLYTSAFVANQDSAYTGSETFRQVLTDSLGKAYSYFAQVPVDNLYESAKVIVSTKDSLILFDSAIAIPKTGILYTTLTLH
jgi:hypothetical protein